MGRYLKYLEIVNKIDAAIEKKAAGKVDIDKDLPKIKTMLEVQDLALKMSMCIDRIDDNVKSSFKLYAKGDPSARGVVEEVLEKMKESGAEDIVAAGHAPNRETGTRGKMPSLTVSTRKIAGVVAPEQGALSIGQRWIMTRAAFGR